MDYNRSYFFCSPEGTVKVLETFFEVDENQIRTKNLPTILTVTNTKTAMITKWQ
jgi:hypothetical protein